MQFFKQANLVLKKDLQIQFREKFLLLSMGTFSLLIQVVFQISFDANGNVLRAIAPGALWLPIFLTAILGFSKYASLEKENGALTGLLLSPIDRGAIYLGKLMGNGIVVLIVAVISLLSFFLFMKPSYPTSLGLLLTTLVLGTWGFTAIGVFLATLALSSSITELLIPMMLFPLSIPLVLATVQLTEMALFPSVDTGLSIWLTLLITYDILFTVLPVLLFELLLEVQE